MSSTDNLPRPADSPCLKCASAGCTSITVGKYGRVNPETVGQATGILDKLARDIFEGDILKIHHKTPLPVGLAVVKYDKKRSAFRAFPVDRPWYACQIAYPDEIVGNIYDDPDLLKQGEDTQK